MMYGILWVKLTPDAKNKLLEMCPNRYEKKFADHVTLLYNVKFDTVPEEMFGSLVELELKEERWNNQIQAVSVALPNNLANMAKHPHITVSSQVGVPPVRSADLFEPGQVENRVFSEMVKIDGFIEFFEFKQRAN